ncbi:hypothetical protein ACIQRS_02975 [Streptomyces termitum]|uniref:Dirigent-like protein n=1 Tax=Streptomyces termitum TaxID=67368 RepID=A0A918SV32_9ACTN|nr:hypothetical protein [Streptomyces termitum]GHA72192.1 hypothetical protein GCM10010305_13040 [Streptomyces termitum]
MTRSSRRIGALGAATVAAVAFATVAPAAAAPAADGFEFTLYAKEVPGGGGGPGAQPKPGDSFAFADDLFRTKGGDKAGRDGVSCTVVRAGDPVDVLCVGTFVLNGGPGGQLTAQTLLTADPSNEAQAAFDIAVTGGTGDFKDARGWIRSTPDGDYSRMEFHLTR